MIRTLRQPGESGIGNYFNLIPTGDALVYTIHSNQITNSILLCSTNNIKREALFIYLKKKRKLQVNLKICFAFMYCLYF